MFPHLAKPFPYNVRSTVAGAAEELRAETKDAETRWARYCLMTTGAEGWPVVAEPEVTLPTFFRGPTSRPLPSPYEREAFPSQHLSE